MKSAVSSLVSSKNLNRSIFHHKFISHKTPFVPTIITTNFSSGRANQPSQKLLIMASSFKPEQARAPPALPLPTPPVTKFKIGLCQLSVTADKERNIAHARKAIEEAAQRGAQLVMLPAVACLTSGCTWWHGHIACHSNNVDPFTFSQA